MTETFTKYQILNMLKCLKKTRIERKKEICENCSLDKMCTAFMSIYEAGRLDAVSLISEEDATEVK